MYDKKAGTDTLRNAFVNTEDLDETLEKYDASMTVKKPEEYISEMLKKNGVKPGEAVARSGLSKSFVYQLLSGERRPTRDAAIRMALSAEMTVDETDEYMRILGYSKLYPRVRRDAAVVFALSRGMRPVDADELLADLGETPLLR